MRTKAGSFWGGYQTPWDKFVYGVTVGQRYLMENTTLGIPALVQSEGNFAFLGLLPAISHNMFPLQAYMASPTTARFGLRPSDWRLPSTQISCRKQPRRLRTKRKVSA